MMPIRLARSQDRVLIDHVHIVDGHGGAPLPGRVLIASERIAQILPEDVAAPPDVTVIDGEGGYLLPASSTCTPTSCSRDAASHPFRGSTVPSRSG
jgi:hypothetical protein